MSSKKITYYFLNTQNNTEIALKYELFNNDFSNRWFRHFEQLIKQVTTPVGTASFYGTSFEDSIHVKKQIDTYISAINSYAQRFKLKERINYDPNLELRIDTLSYLHACFQELEKDKLFNSKSIKIQFTLKNLHLFIHKAESVLPQVKDQGSFVEVSLTSEKTNFGIKLEEDDYQYFSPDYNWGSLMVGYGKIGVPTMHAYHTKATPYPQNQFNSDTLLYFYKGHSISDEEREKAGQWLQSTHKIDINDPRSAIGRLEIGKLITTIPNRAEFMNEFSYCKKLSRIEIS
jgi:hypothetical protein